MLLELTRINHLNSGWPKKKERQGGRFGWSPGKGVFKIENKVELLNASPLAGVIGKVGYIVLFMAAG